MEQPIEILVEKANSGDKRALETVVMEIKDLIYSLSLKMLLFPEDAEDATQEILIKVITHLSTFSHQSKFTTWVYRVATNYLLTHKGKRSKEFAMPFDEYSILVESGQSSVVNYSKNEGEISLLEEEVKISCTQGLLLCLTELDRMVYILSAILEFDSNEGGAILGITPQNFRKKKSRAIGKIRNFMNNKCGLANPDNPCRCTKKIDFLIQKQIIDPHKLRFAHISGRSIDLIDQISHLEKSVAIFRSNPKFNAPDTLVHKIKEIITIR